MTTAMTKTLKMHFFLKINQTSTLALAATINECGVFTNVLTCISMAEKNIPNKIY